MSNDPESGTDQIALLIERLNGGDSAVITELIEVCDRRMRRLAKVMLQGRPDVHRWVETNDIHQESVTKLLHTLRMVANGTMKAIDGVKHFERIAARHIRHQLIDQARHFLGPQGEGSKHESHNIDTPGNPLSDAESPSQDQHLLSQSLSQSQLKLCKDLRNIHHHRCEENSLGFSGNPERIYDLRIDVSRYGDSVMLRDSLSMV